MKSASVVISPNRSAIWREMAEEWPNVRMVPQFSAMVS